MNPSPCPQDAKHTTTTTYMTDHEQAHLAGLRLAGAEPRSRYQFRGQRGTSTLYANSAASLTLHNGVACITSRATRSFLVRPSPNSSCSASAFFNAVSSNCRKSASVQKGHHSFYLLTDLRLEGLEGGTRGITRGPGAER